MRISFVLPILFLWTGPTMVDVLGLGYSLVDDVCTLVADKPAKRFKCDCCPKAFAESGSLTRHERTQGAHVAAWPSSRWWQARALVKRPDLSQMYLASTHAAPAHIAAIPNIPVSRSNPLVVPNVCSKGPMR